MRKMRPRLVGLLSLGLIPLGGLLADDAAPAPTANPPEKPNVVARRPQPRTTVQEKLIQERAAFRARQRVARMEARSWAGVSPQRPNVRGPGIVLGVNPHPLWGLPGYSMDNSDLPPDW